MTEILFSKMRPVLSACRRWNVPDYRSHATEIIGRDPMTDPALIRIEAFVRKIRQYRQGDTVLFLINREGSTLFVTLTIPG